MEENRRNMRRRRRFGGRSRRSSVSSLASRRGTGHRSRVTSNRQQAASRGMTRGGFLRSTGLAAAGLGAAALGMGRVARAEKTVGNPNGAVVVITSEGDESYTTTPIALAYDAKNGYIAVAPLIVEGQQWEGGPFDGVVAGATETEVLQGVTIKSFPFENPNNPMFYSNNQRFYIEHGLVYEGVLHFYPNGAPGIPADVIWYILQYVPFPGEPPEDPPTEPVEPVAGETWTLIGKDGTGTLHGHVTPTGIHVGTFQGTVNLLDENFDIYKVGAKLLLNITGPSNQVGALQYPRLSRIDIFE